MKNKVHYDLSAVMIAMKRSASFINISTVCFFIHHSFV